MYLLYFLKKIFMIIVSITYTIHLDNDLINTGENKILHNETKVDYLLK